MVAHDVHIMPAIAFGHIFLKKRFSVVSQEWFFSAVL
jgi:hypothetical protein